MVHSQILDTAYTLYIAKCCQCKRKEYVPIYFFPYPIKCVRKIIETVSEDGLSQTLIFTSESII